MTTFEPGDLEQQLVRDRWLRQLAARLAWEGVDSDDVAQEAWLAALRRPPRMDDGSGARGWFARVLRNAARDGHRRWRRRRDHEQHAASDASRAHRSSESNSCPSDALLALEQRRTLLDEVERLAEPFRSAIVARYLECGSEAEAAARLGVALETLRSRLKRGRELLRARLEQRLGGAPALFAFVSSLAAGDAPIAPLSPALSAASMPSNSEVYAALTMKSSTKLALASLALLVTAGVGVGITLTQRNASNELRALTADTEELAVLTPPAMAASEPDAHAVRRALETSPREDVAASPEPEFAVVLGRVADEHGRPLSGGMVQLTAWQAMAVDRGLPLLDARRKRVGAEAATDADGAFRVAAPLCGIRDVTLRIEGGAYRDFRVIHFGSDSDRVLSLPALTAGEHDVGELRLGATGAIQGVVVDSEGRPLADVEVDLGPERGTSYGIDHEVWTDAHGIFHLPHAPIGVHWMHVSLAGYTKVDIERVQVEPNATLECGTIPLERAGTLTGSVRGTDGAPLGGVQLYAWPRGSGRTAGARTDDDGRFVLSLCQPVPHQLEAKKAGFVPRPRGQKADDATYYEPGASGIEFVLTPGEGAAKVAPQTPAAPPTGTVRGRVLDGDAPVAGARVRIAARVTRQQELRRADDSWDALRSGFPAPGAHVQIVRAEPMHATFAETDAEGRFEATGAHVERIHVTVFRPGKAPHVHLPERHTGGAERDLGEIPVLEGGSVDGTVLVPPGVDPLGLVVEVGEARTYTDAKGRFSVTGVPAGKSHVVLNGRTGALEEGAAASVTVEPGGKADVVIDARLYGMCDVALRVSINGVPAAGARATLDDGQPISGIVPNLDPCDASGFARGFVRALHSATLSLKVPELGTIEVREPPIVLVPGTRIERTYELECGDLELLLPPSVELPTAGYVRLALSADGDEWMQREVQCGRDGPAAGATLVDGRLRAPLFLTGRYRMQVSFAEDAAGYTEVPLGNRRVTWRRVAYFEWSGDIDIRRGEVTLVDLARQ